MDTDEVVPVGVVFKYFIEGSDHNSVVGQFEQKCILMHKKCY